MFYSEISSIDDVTDKQRDTTKQTCYGILYGMGAQTLAQQMNTSETDAQNAMDSFMNSYPMVKVYFNRLVAQCKEKGYIETISGRRRYLPEIKSVRLKMRSHAERQAVNSTIQGSAADIVKMATYKIHCAVASLGWNTLHQNTRSNTTDFFLVHHIHDELIYEVDEKKLHEAVSVIERCMVDAFPMSVKLAVRIKVGKLWGDLNKYENFIPVL
uniref:DNA-directed DNA polymerase family A palm domain-containing protein n=2 Tax=Ciona intestinalis TaxID=7719 RepID=F6Q9I1_CIOIN